MEQNPINLFQSQATLSPTFTIVERYLRLTRYILLYVILGIGAVTLIVYMIFRFQQQSLEVRRKQVYAIVQQNITKEAMLLTLRARVLALQKIMMYQISIAPYIDTTLLIASPPVLKSFSLESANVIRISIDASSLEEAITVVGTVVQLTKDNKIQNPNITSIVLGKDAKVTMGFTYAVVLQ